MNDQHEKPQKYTKLIVVPGHAIYVGSECSHARHAAHWEGTFPGYQNDDEVDLYYEHVRTAVSITARDYNQDSLLVFSGGETRHEAGPYSEAQGYWVLARQCNWFGYSDTVAPRTATEEFARDSFENLLFSVHRYYQVARALPERVVVCGFGFKRNRYEFHWETLFKREYQSQLRGSLPIDLCVMINKKHLEYVSVNEPPAYILEGPGGSGEGEEITLSQFKDDPTAVKEPLIKKEEKRDEYRRFNPYGLDR